MGAERIWQDPITGNPAGVPVRGHKLALVKVRPRPGTREKIWRDPMTGKRLPSGVRVKNGKLFAAVMVRPGPGGQLAKAFEPGTDLDEIVAWQASARLQIKRQQPVSGTLAGDIDKGLQRLKAQYGEGSRRVFDATGRLKPWAVALGQKPRALITADDVRRTLEGWRMAKRYKGPTLNRMRQELVSLWRTLDGRDHTCPALAVDKYADSVPRKGFFEQDALQKVLDSLPEHYADVVKFAAFSGWRRQEIEGLVWSEVDLQGGVIRLSPERSKNRDGRVLPIAGPLVEIMKRRAASRNGLPFVFCRTIGGKKPGHATKPVRHLPVGDWRKTWANACKAAGCKGAMLHDLRRTVVRSLTRAGVPERVAMGWTGHKTRSVFDRYDIVDEGDLHAAAAQLTTFLEKR